ncbi:MAG: glycosyl transferase group 1 [Proteobacteria bacterium]|nr:glycosyl transferase group 1 [Pseudomonadota bacterium]
MHNHSVFVAAALPPPVHGQSVVNKAVCDELSCREKTGVTVCDISPGQSKRGVNYHLRRVFSVLKAARLLVLGGVKRSQCAYFVLESGYGVVYNIFLITLARLVGRRVFLHHHTAFHSLAYSRVFAWVAKLCGYDAVHFALCEGMKSDLLRHYPHLNEVRVVNNAVFVSEFQVTEKRRSDNTFILGHISNLCAEKGTLTVFKTFEACFEAKLVSKIIVAGPVTDIETEIALRALQLKYGDAVQYLGPVYGDAKQQFYADIDVALFPSQYRFEAQPLVVLEALQSGVPILSTSQGYIADLLSDVGLVMPSDPDMYKAAVIGSLTHWSSEGGTFDAVCNQSRLHYQHLRGVSSAQFAGMIQLLLGGNSALAQ